MSAIKIIQAFARKSLTKNQGSGIISLPSDFMAAEKAAQIELLLSKAGIPTNQLDDFIRSEADLLKYLNIIENANQPKVFSGQEAMDKLNKLFPKKGEVVDMSGKKLDAGKPIIGGTQDDSASGIMGQIKDRMKNINKANDRLTELLEEREILYGKAPKTKKNKKVQEREMFSEANERFNQKGDVITETLTKLTNMEPVAAMKEANKVIGRKGAYKNLTEEQSQKILKDSEDWIFQRDPSDRWDYKKNKPYRDDPDFDPDDPSYDPDDGLDYAAGGRAGYIHGGNVHPDGRRGFFAGAEKESREKGKSMSPGTDAGGNRRDNNPYTGGDDNKFVDTTNYPSKVTEKIKEKFYTPPVDKTNKFFSNLRKYQTLNKNLDRSGINFFRNQGPKNISKELLTNALSTLSLEYPDIKIQNEDGFINAENLKTVVDKAILDGKISPIEGLTLTQSIGTTGDPSGIGVDYSNNFLNFNTGDINSGTYGIGTNYNLGDLNLNTDFNVVNDNLDSKTLAFDYGDGTLTGSQKTYPGSDFQINEAALNKNFNINDNFKVGIDGKVKNLKSDGSTLFTDQSLTPSLTFNKNIGDGILSSNISKEIMEGGDAANLGLGYNKNGFYARGDNLLDEDRTGTIGYQKNIGDFTDKGDFGLTFGAEKNLFDDEWTAGAGLKYKFNKGGRAGFYTGGITDVKPSLDDIGHGSDSLMARTRLLSPNNQATTSTGLNYLLAEDNDNIRVPFSGGGDPRRRAFLKLMATLGGGIAGIKSGLFGGLFGKGAAQKTAKEIVKQSAGSNAPPPYFFKLVDKIKTMGDETIASQDHAIAKKYKDYVMEEDFAGNISIIKKNMDDPYPEEVIMSYKVDEVSLPNKKGMTKVDEYEEFTVRPDGDGKMKDIEPGVPDEVVNEGSVFEDNMTEFGMTKKADGGRIGFSGGNLAKSLAGKSITGSSRRFLEKVFGKERFATMIENDPRMHRGMLEVVEMFRKKDKEGLKMYLQKFLPHMDDAQVEDFIIGGEGTEGITGQLIRLGSGREYKSLMDLSKQADNIRKLENFDIDDVSKNAEGGRIGFSGGGIFRAIIAKAAARAGVKPYEFIKKTSYKSLPPEVKMFMSAEDFAKLKSGQETMYNNYIDMMKTRKEFQSQVEAGKKSPASPIFEHMENMMDKQSYVPKTVTVDDIAEAELMVKNRFQKGRKDNAQGGLQTMLGE